MSFYRWCMRCGAPILFLVALIQLLVALSVPVYELLSSTGRMASNHGYMPDGSSAQWLQSQLLMIAGAIASAALPFFGALVIDRLDRRQAANDARAEGGEVA